MTIPSNNLDKRKDPFILGISLFEEQIVRAFFLSDNFYLLKQLSLKYKVIIFTNEEIGDFLDVKLKELGIDITSIFKLKVIRERFLVKFFSFLLKWSDPSSATIRNLYREKNNQRMGIISFWQRKIFFHIFSHSVYLKKIFRSLLLFVHKLDNDVKMEIPNVDLFVSTALTNSESDLPLSIYFKKKGIVVISSLRSWDNLVTKGTLKFQPDIFLSHSGYMTDLAIRVHGIKSISVLQSVTPSYQNRFLPKAKQNNVNSYNVAYGCIGPILNPDELNFLKWLGEISSETDTCISVVQHPKFKHDLSKINKGNLNFKTFEYLSSTLEDYYRFIAEQDLVIASGTSLALDSLFVGTPLIGLAFEIIEQDYWLSHLRSYDQLPHSKYLFDKLSIRKVTSKLELIEILNGKKVYQKIKEGSDILSYLTGDSSIQFHEQILRLIDSRLILK